MDCRTDADANGVIADAPAITAADLRKLRYSFYRRMKLEFVKIEKK